ncbi:MAG: O-acetyl-ADP-ribose deacetylase [Caldithrix sp.]|nr:O-acetyl-ADP-ribose deacetylase [Caldithrix sp.]
MEQAMTIGHGRLKLMIGDITQLSVDAVVNAANAQLKLGGGVAGAIARAGGPEIQQECDRIGGTHVGGAVITTGGNLPAQKVIHAVGPRMGEGREDEKLARATRNSLKVAEENGLQSIAFPAISTGIFGYPVDRCAQIMVREAVDYLKQERTVRDIIFCLFDQNTFDTFAEELPKQTP